MRVGRSLSLRSSVDPSRGGSSSSARQKLRMLVWRVNGVARREQKHGKGRFGLRNAEGRSQPLQQLHRLRNGDISVRKGVRVEKGGTEGRRGEETGRGTYRDCDAFRPRA